MGKSHLFEIPFSRYFSCKSFSETWESHLAANSTQQKLCCMFPHNNEASTHQKQFPCKLSQFEKQNVIIPFSPPSWKGDQRIPFYRNPIFKVLFLFSVWEPKSHFIEIPFSREGTVYYNDNSSKSVREAGYELVLEEKSKIWNYF